MATGVQASEYVKRSLSRLVSILRSPVIDLSDLEDHLRLSTVRFSVRRIWLRSLLRRSLAVRPN